MKLPVLVRLVLLALLLSLAGAQPCPSEMNSVKDLLEVNCTGQGFSVVPSALPRDVGILLLSANRLTSVSTSAFLPLVALQDLDLSHNGLVALNTESPLPSLKELSLSHNALEALPTLRGLPGLTHLALAHNRMRLLPPRAFQATPRLQYLDLQGNSLRILPSDALAGLRALKELDLSDNVLEELPQELLQDLRVLETLWLSGNLLQTLPPGFFTEGHFFQYVFLTGNRWHCDCDLLYLRAWIRQNEVSVYKPKRSLEKTEVEVAPRSVRCHSPEEQKQKPVMDFKPDCGTVGDAHEEEEEEYSYGEVTEEATSSFRPHSTTHGDRRTPTFAPFTSASAALHSDAASRRIPSTWIAAPTASLTPRGAQTAFPLSSAPRTNPSSTASLWAPSPATPMTIVPSGATASTRVPLSIGNSVRIPSTWIAAPATLPTTWGAQTAFPLASTPGTTASSTPSLWTPSPATPMTTIPPGATASTHVPLPIGATSTTPTPKSSAAIPFTSSPPIPDPVAALSARPGSPVPLCPCPGAGATGPPWLCFCLLRWALYLAPLVSLLLSVTALLGWLLWLRRTGWDKAPHGTRYPLLGRTKPTEPPGTLWRPMFCTIKEVELRPDAAPSHTYCTLKDLAPRHEPPARASFRTTKELWIRPPSATAVEPISP